MDSCGESDSESRRPRVRYRPPPVHDGFAARKHALWESTAAAFLWCNTYFLPAGRNQDDAWSFRGARRGLRRHGSTQEREAQAALDAVKAEWKEVPQISSKELFAYLKQNAAAKTEDRFHKQKGSIEEGLANAAHRLDATYTIAYIAHAPLEPRAAVAQWADDKLTVWTGTQRPFANRDELAAVFHLPESSVRVIVPDTGSAYGGKHTSDAAMEAARLARAAGRPVKVVWTREVEF